MTTKSDTKTDRSLWALVPIFASRQRCWLREISTFIGMKVDLVAKEKNDASFVENLSQSGIFVENLNLNLIWL
nr:hypothetical protein CFP56_55343 [Quercus suber]